MARGTDTCSECGAKLADDQRYCVNCGAARADARLDVSKHLGPGGPARVDAGAAGAAQRQQFWTPLAAVGAIAVLGAMLLLGVLIGKDEDDDNATTTVTAPAATTAAPAPTTTAPTTTAPPATTTPTTPGAETLPPPAGDIGGATPTPSPPTGKGD